MRVSYQHASARIVLDASGVLTGKGHAFGRVVLNVTDGAARGVTVQDVKTGKALLRVDALSIMSAGFLGASARDRATLAGFTR